MKLSVEIVLDHEDGRQPERVAHGELTKHGDGFTLSLSKWKLPELVWRRGTLARFDASALGVWDLLYAALAQLVGSRTRDQTFVTSDAAYEVTRVDGNPPGWVFVIDEADPLAPAVLSVYASLAGEAGDAKRCTELREKTRELLDQQRLAGVLHSAHRAPGFVWFSRDRASDS